MGKKKKDTIELRFYEIPQNEYVLALLGENWIRDYGHDEVHLHFHNLMEIGVCRNGTGKLILDEEQRPYQPAMVSIIPNNYPHVTISNTKEGPSYWEYLFFDPAQIIADFDACIFTLIGAGHGIAVWSYPYSRFLRALRFINGGKQ